MNATQLRSWAAGSRNDEDVSKHETTTDSESGSSSWRRRLLVGAAVVVAGAYLRRRLSGSTDRTQAESTEGKRSESGNDSSTEGGSDIGRRLKVLVVSTVVFAIARGIVRQYKRKR